MINPDSKHPCIYDDDNVTLYLEMCEHRPFIHCTVHKWTHGTLKEFKVIWDSMITAFTNKGYEEIYASDMDDKVTKFAKMFGFKETENKTLGDDNKIRGVLKWHQQ